MPIFATAALRMDLPMSTPEDVRTAALALPEAEEHPHWDRPSFRVRGKIFATLREDENRAVLKLPLAEQSALTALQPAVFSIAPWGHQGWTFVELPSLTPDELQSLIASAWGNVAPKRVVAAFFSSSK